MIMDRAPTLSNRQACAQAKPVTIYDHADPHRGKLAGIDTIYSLELPHRKSNVTHILDMRVKT
jgi:hypothetical protein